MSEKSSGVRPTRSCLDGLGLKIPSLDMRLSDLDHALIKEAQRVPAAHEAGGVERIRALNDRVWLKAKTRRWRGAVTCLSEHDQISLGGPPDPPARWWLGAGGYRRDGDPSDFYESMAATAGRDGKGSGKPRSERWLPAQWDWQRLGLGQRSCHRPRRRNFWTLFHKKTIDGVTDLPGAFAGGVRLVRGLFPRFWCFGLGRTRSRCRLW